jgi:eukaryotic-like serine/threonine-protein kinase
LGRSSLGLGEALPNHAIAPCTVSVIQLSLFSVITLSLLHPIKQSPVQVWTFQNESVIRIGRSTDNHVILYSAVVSRHHVELRRVGSDWEIVNLGTNGTYLDGKRITQVALIDGAVIRLARSGPNIKIRLGAEPVEDLVDGSVADRPIMSQRVDPSNYSTDILEKSLGATAIPGGVSNSEDLISQQRGTIPVPPHLRLESLDELDSYERSLFGETTQDVPSLGGASRGDRCQHPRGGDLFCVDCGQPLNPLDVLVKPWS